MTGVLYPKAKAKLCKGKTYKNCPDQKVCCAILAWLIRNTYCPDPEIFANPVPDSYNGGWRRKEISFSAVKDDGAWAARAIISLSYPPPPRPWGFLFFVTICDSSRFFIRFLVVHGLVWRVVVRQDLNRWVCFGPCQVEDSAAPRPETAPARGLAELW